MRQKQCNILKYFVILAIILWLSACGAGKDYNPSQTNDDPTSYPVHHGIFLDSPVEGLNYTTPTLFGMTDSFGTFEYRNNEEISFYIADIFIAQTMAQAQITPIDLFPSASEITDPRVTNLCRFLQALDDDNNPDNGILISSMVRDMLSNKNISINFEQDIESFEADISRYVLNLTDKTLPTVKSAQKHLRQTLYGELLDFTIPYDPDVTFSIPAGMSFALTAIGRFYKDNQWIEKEITSLVTWSTSNNSIATMSESDPGVVSSYDMGPIQINARIENLNDLVDIQIVAPILTKIIISPQNPFLHPNNTQQFKALGIFSDQSTKDVTQVVTWSSKNNNIAIVMNENGQKGNIRALSEGKTQIIAEHNGTMAAADITVYDGILTEIQIQSDNNTHTIPKGFHKQYRAFGIYSDDTRPDITEQVIWKSNHHSIARVSKGLVEAVAKGETQISASLGEIYSQVTLTVSDAALEKILITPQNKTIPLYSQEQFKAEAVYSDMTVENITDQVMWISTNPQVAIFIDDTHRGRVDAESPGMTTIMATHTSTETNKTLTGTTFLSVSDAELDSIIVDPQSISIPLGTMHQFTATGLFEDEIDDDITDKVTWTSSDISVARVSNDIPNKGLVNTLSVGTAYIRATFQNITEYSELAVLSPGLIKIQISPDIYAIEIGETRQLFANGYYTNSTINDITNLVTWSSSNPDVIQITNGLIEGFSSGQAEITASLNDKSQFLNIVVY